MENRTTSRVFDHSADIFAEPISPNNVREMGEVIALRAIKTLIPFYGRPVETLWKALIRDIHRFERNEYTDILSNGYDAAQTAICFLCNYMGRSVHEIYGKNGKGKLMTIKNACYKEVDRWLLKNIGLHTVSLHDLDRHDEPSIPFEVQQEQDYAKVDAVIAKMQLQPYEEETLSCYMAGMTYVQIARFLCVNNTTIWRRRMSIRKKYNLHIGDFNNG